MTNNAVVLSAQYVKALFQCIPLELRKWHISFISLHFFCWRLNDVREEVCPAVLPDHVVLAASVHPEEG